MDSSETLESFTDRWLEARERGHDLTPETLCPDRPELHEKLRERLNVLRSMLDRLATPHTVTLPSQLKDSRPSIPGFEILDEAGVGGMGAVYKARDTRLQRLVALKVIRGTWASSAQRQRFVAEAKAVARLQHPNIVQIHEANEGETPFLSLEWMEGGTLDARLRGSPLAVRAAAELCEPIARAIHFAHQRGIIHRDLKPSNVLLAVDGTPKVSDFGLAKDLTEDGLGLTVSGVPLGTPAYMAPEQARGESATTAADVYGLGAILYQCLTNKPPFRADSQFELLKLVAAQPPARPGQLRTDLPRDLDTICLKCLEKEPGKRYASAEALADDLRRFLEHKPVLARPIGAIGRARRWCRRNRAIASLLFVVVMALVIGGLGITWKWLEAESNLQLAEKNDYFNRITLADQAWMNSRLDLVHSYLNDCPPTKFDWEWYYLKKRANAELAAVMRVDQFVGNLHFSPDGRTVACRQQDAIRYFDLETGVIQSTPAFAGESVFASTFTKDGVRWAAHRQNPNEVVIREGAAGKAIARFAGHWTHFAVAVFSTDGQVLVLLHEPHPKCKSCELWDVPTGRLLSVLKHGGDQPECAAFDRNGHLVAVAGLQQRIALYEARTGAFRGFLGNEVFDIGCLAFSPDGKQLATATRLFDPRFADKQAEIAIWDIERGERIARSSGQFQDYRFLIYHPDGRRLASSSNDGTFRIWNVDSIKEVLQIRGHANCGAIAFTPDGSLLAAIEEDCVVRLWDADRGQNVWMGRVPSARHLHRAAISSNGDTVFAAPGGAGLLYSWQVDSKDSARTLFTGPTPLTAYKLFANGTSLVAGLENGKLVLLDWKSGAIIGEWPAHVGRIKALDVSADGQFIVSAGEDKEIHLWDAKSFALVRSFVGHTNEVRCVCLSQTKGRPLLASGGNDKTARVWDASSGTELTKIADLHSHVLAVAFSPDQRLLAFSTTGSLVAATIWDLERDAIASRCVGHKKGITCLMFSRDGKRLFTGSDDWTIRIWETLTGREALSIRDHQGGITGLSLSENGERLASSSWDGTVRVWDAPRLPIPYSNP